MARNIKIKKNKENPETPEVLAASMNHPSTKTIFVGWKPRDQWTRDAMRQYGGSFVKLLGELAEHADAENLHRIKESWPDYWAEYEKKGIEMEKGNA